MSYCDLDGKCYPDSSQLQAHIQDWICEQNETEKQSVLNKLNYSQQELEELTQAVRELMQIQDVKIVKVLGSGKSGVAVYVCNQDVGGFVIKIITEPRVDEKEFEREFRMQQLFYDAGLAPEPIGHEFGDKYKFVIMAKLGGGMVRDLIKRSMTQQDYRILADKLLTFMDTMCAYRICHQDFHWGNIGYANPVFTGWADIELQVIDFGMARDNICGVEIDLSCLLKNTFQYPILHTMLEQEFWSRYVKPQDYKDDFVWWDGYYLNLLNASMKEIGGPQYKKSKPRHQSHSQSDTVVQESFKPLTQSERTMQPNYTSQYPSVMLSTGPTNHSQYPSNYPTQYQSQYASNNTSQYASQYPSQYPAVQLSSHPSPHRFRYAQTPSPSYSRLKRLKTANYSEEHDF